MDTVSVSVFLNACAHMTRTLRLDGKTEACEGITWMMMSCVWGCYSPPYISRDYRQQQSISLSMTFDILEIIRIGPQGTPTLTSPPVARWLAHHVDNNTSYQSNGIPATLPIRAYNPSP